MPARLIQLARRNMPVTLWGRTNTGLANQRLSKGTARGL